jgi:hypothetical protein
MRDYFVAKSLLRSCCIGWRSAAVGAGRPYLFDYALQKLNEQVVLVSVDTDGLQNTVHGSGHALTAQRTLFGMTIPRLFRRVALTGRLNSRENPYA